MYIINPTTKITAIAASSEDPNYPKANVQDDFRTNPWKSGVSADSTLTLTVAAGAQAVGIAYVNSPTVRVQVDNPAYNTLHTINAEHPNLFVYYGLASGAHTVILTFADPGSDVPYCGIVRCSSVYEFLNPEYGLNEGLKDYSVKKRYNKGALYYLQRDIVRTFSGSIRVDRDANFWTFLHTIAKARGCAPMFWQVTDVNAIDWAVFAELEELPDGSHDLPSKSSLSFSLIEAI